MSRDLYAQETVERFGQFDGTQVPEPDAFTGFAEGTGKLALRGFAGTLRGMDLLGSIPAITRDYFKGGTEEQDQYFRMHDWRYNRLIDDLTPGPKDVGVAGQIVGGLLGTLPQILINPPVGLASMSLSASEDLVREGVPAWRANLVGTAQAAATAIGMRIPLGETLLQRMLIGGAAANVAVGMGARAVSGAILTGLPQAEQFKVFDTTQMSIDLLMGLAFGAYAHLTPSQKAQGGEPLKELSDFAQRMKPSEIDALATIRQAQHAQSDSMPGKPVDPTDVEAHVNRLKAAIGQLARDEPVNVQDMPAPKFTPDPVKEAGDVQRMNELVKASEEVRQQEGLTEPKLPAELQATDEQRATYESLRQLPREEQAEGVGQVIEAQLRKAGIQEDEALAHGAVWRAFAKTAGEKYGISPADVLTAKNLIVSRGTERIMGALEQLPGDTAGTVEVNGVRRPTTDSTGKEIAPTTEGVRTFYKWFGDSKVVDEQGRPLVVYHGTPADFHTFEGTAPRNIMADPAAEGFYFSSQPETAESYGGSVMPVYLRAENPQMVDAGSDLPHPAWISKKRRAELEAQGHDGIIFNDGEEIVVFKPEQIKSALGNRGTFDPNNPNILLQEARAQIHFGEHETIINLFQTANASTFVHETGHYFLQFLRDLANSPNAPMRAMEDWAAFAKEYKIEGGEITRETHEEFARTWEAYLRNGEAPTPELKGVFQQFRDWLIEIYKSLVELKVKLTPERQALMDSLLTSQRQDSGETGTAPPESATGFPPPLGIEAPAGAVHTDAQTVSAEEIQIVARASALDAAAVEKAGRDFADDPAAFINEMRKIVHGNETEETAQTQGEAQSETGNEADRLLAQEADRFVAEKPDQMIDIGTDAAGKPVQVTAKQFLEEARAAAAQAREDIKLLEVAAGCLLGRS